MIVASERTVFFTGAGISTESGIPDFRSPGGIWDRHPPIEYQDFLASAEMRRETWRRGLETYAVVEAARPNPAHLAIAELEHLSKLDALITQNVDGLHALAGSSTERTIELHGTSHGVRCLDCDRRYPRRDVHLRVLAGELEPSCLFCAGILKPTTISFGEAMPVDAMMRAQAAARGCDLFVVAGSSLVVYPAAGLPETAQRSGARLVVVNATPTHLDAGAALCLEGKAGEILPVVVARVRRLIGAAPR
ncbi:MAG: NAD-dependent deacetylase [Chloroflexi bacterium]|nr:NAD-dependent deacetylase [Chloroflexota bacterium]